jgi:hypothetical protein
MKCPACERLTKARKEAQIIYDSAQLLLPNDRSSLPPTPTETVAREQDAELRLRAYRSLSRVQEELSIHQATHRNGQVKT